LSGFKLFARNFAGKGVFLIEEAANQVASDFAEHNKAEWRQIRDHFVKRAVLRYVNKVLSQSLAANPKQQVLEGLESMPLLVTADGAAILSESLIYDKYQNEMKVSFRRTCVKSTDSAG
jgi:hypothetical protein